VAGKHVQGRVASNNFRDATPIALTDAWNCRRNDSSGRRGAAAAGADREEAEVHAAGGPGQVLEGALLGLPVEGLGGVQRDLRPGVTRGSLSAQ
jgi:hypothetical protein